MRFSPSGREYGFSPSGRKLLVTLPPPRKFFRPPSPPGLPTACEVNVGSPKPRCRDCVPGWFVCEVHLKPCGAEQLESCGFCWKILCNEHQECQCWEAEAARAEYEAKERVRVSEIKERASQSECEAKENEKVRASERVKESVRQSKSEREVTRKGERVRE